MKSTSQYLLEPFQQIDEEKPNGVIGSYPPATLISQDERFPTVIQVSLVLGSTAGKLERRLDRNTPQREHVLKGGDILRIFNVPNHYMTPGIYPDTLYPGRTCVSMRVTGAMRACEDAAAVLAGVNLHFQSRKRRIKGLQDLFAVETFSVISALSWSDPNI